MPSGKRFRKMLIEVDSEGMDILLLGLCHLERAQSSIFRRQQQTLADELHVLPRHLDRAASGKRTCLLADAFSHPPEGLPLAAIWELLVHVKQL